MAQGCSWAPDGRQIAYWDHVRGEESSAIYVMGADGSRVTQLTYEQGRWDKSPVWSPGTRLAFEGRRGPHAASDIYVMDGDGGNQTNVTNSAEEETSPAWSPDGRRIAFVRDGIVCILDLSCARAVPVTAGDHPTWSPDGRGIAFDHLAREGVWIWRMTLASRAKWPISAPEAFIDRQPAWSAW